MENPLSLLSDCWHFQQPLLGMSSDLAFLIYSMEISQKSKNEVSVLHFFLFCNCTFWISDLLIQIVFPSQWSKWKMSLWHKGIIPPATLRYPFGRSWFWNLPLFPPTSTQESPSTTCIHVPGISISFVTQSLLVGPLLRWYYGSESSSIKGRCNGQS